MLFPMPDCSVQPTGETRPKTVLTWMRETDEPLFQPIFDRFPAVEVLNTRVCDAEIGRMDGLLLTGGSDISGSLASSACAGSFHDPRP